MILKIKSGKDIKDLNFEGKKNLLSILAENGYNIPAACGGNGTCGKCKVKIISGKIEGAKVDNFGFILACEGIIFEDIYIELAENIGGGITKSYKSNVEFDGEKGYGIALDIGTTTLAFYLINLETGNEVENFSTLNPQGVFGADVISRIKACDDGKLSLLYKAINHKTNSVIKYFKDKYKINSIEKLVVCGNTTMLHLFNNTDASSLGKYPFTPIFLDMQNFDGCTKNIDANKVVLLPSICSYVGSDISAGIIATAMNLPNINLLNNNIDEKNEVLVDNRQANNNIDAKNEVFVDNRQANNNIDAKNEVFVDIGTNGEMVAVKNGKLTCASTAAGPAFEGANISLGMGGISGAINSVKLVNGKIIVTTIDNKQPIGICGAGLIDAISCMKNLEIIDETGAFNESCDNENIYEDKFYLTDKVYITQKDVREFQLAKSAICSGLKVLIKRAGLNYSEIDRLYIAGGLGFYIDKESSINIGLFPKELKDKIVVVGNSGGLGAKMCLLKKSKLLEIEKVASECKNIDLSTDDKFIDEFMDNMYF